MQTVRTNLKVVPGGASTQYTNFNHSAMCMFNGLIIGAGPDGLFKACCGDDDNGDDIDAYFVPYSTDMGTNFGKRTRTVYVGARCKGGLSLLITGDETDTNGPYTVESEITDAPKRIRFPIKRFKSWSYGKFKFSNVDGSFFSIDYAEVINIITSKRRK